MNTALVHSIIAEFTLTRSPQSARTFSTWLTQTSALVERTYDDVGVFTTVETPHEAHLRFAFLLFADAHAASHFLYDVVMPFVKNKDSGVQSLCLSHHNDAYPEWSALPIAIGSIAPDILRYVHHVMRDTITITYTPALAGDTVTSRVRKKRNDLVRFVFSHALAASDHEHAYEDIGDLIERAWHAEESARLSDFQAAIDALEHRLTTETHPCMVSCEYHLLRAANYHANDKASISTAMAHAVQAEAIARELDLVIVSAHAHYRRARALLSLGQTHEAKRQAYETLHVLQTLPESGLAASLAGTFWLLLATIETIHEDPDRAEVAIRKAKTLATRVEPTANIERTQFNRYTVAIARIGIYATSRLPARALKYTDHLEGHVKSLTDMPVSLERRVALLCYIAQASAQIHDRTRYRLSIAQAQMLAPEHPLIEKVLSLRP